MSSSPRRPAGVQAGFTLVEALIAMVILSFGLIAVTNLMLVASTSNTVANQSTAATSIASQQLEQLKILPFADPGLTTGGDLDNDAAGYFAEVQVPGVGAIHTRWLITDVDPTTKHIAVRSEGRGALAGPRSRAEFTTFRVLNP
jgi:prepilin-type N-terminal cleavage/methylation domain-containing protein